MAINGADVLILVNVGTEIAPDYKIVGSQRGVTFSETTDEIDVSSKEARAGRYLPGRYGATITLDALYMPSDDGYLTLLSAMRNGEFVTVRVQEEGAQVEQANAIVTDLSRTAPDQDASTCSVTLRVDGEWQTLGT